MDCLSTVVERRPLVEVRLYFICARKNYATVEVNPKTDTFGDRHQVILLKSKVRFIESQIKGVKRQGPTPGVRFTEVSVL